MRGIIWARYLEDGKQQLLQMKKNYEDMNIKPVREIMHSGDMAITFDNGDYWRVVRVSESARGYRANVSYVDAGIDSEFMECVIRPTTIARPYNAIHFYYPSRMRDEIDA